MKHPGTVQKIGLALAFALALLCPLGAAAEVTAVREQTGPLGTVYVAGNPDLYPLEYYDAEHRCYAGVMPQLLEEISQATGVGFTYVSAGPRDQRARLAQNQQVELVSGLVGQEGGQYVQPGAALLTITLDGASYPVSFGYTAIASDTLRQTVEEAIASLDPAELTGMAVAIAVEERRRETPLWAMAAMVVFAVLSLAWAAFSIYWLLRYKRRPKSEQFVDQLTGVGNRAYFQYHFQNSITEAAAPLYYVFYLGYDFSRVQTQYGEDEAENLLRYVADVLAQQAGENDFFGRIGAGNFAMAAQCVNREKAVEYALQLLHKIEAYREKFDKDYDPQARVGIYPLRRDDTSCETVLYNAQQGFRCAVEQDRPYVISDEETLMEARRVENLRRQLLHAVEVREFKCYLHVMKEVGTGRIFGAEMLSRWNHPEYGLLPPGKYISNMEQTGAITALDWYMLEAACRLLEGLGKDGGQPICLFCNIAAQTFAQPDFCTQLETVASRYRFPREMLGLEVTEQALFDNGDAALANAAQCNKAGFKLALDGVGSGYSSFSKMLRCQIDMVKFDRKVLLQAGHPRGKSCWKG